ncbi:MAG: DUF424 family protein [Thermoplasmata archaeon]|nr:MAG: DUF424 family protein [Thermoplasmata archaeon]
MVPKIAMKIYKHANEVLLAACDEDLLGKTFRDGKLNLEVSRDFYDDTRVDKVLFLRSLQLSTISNLVGETTINTAIDAGFVDKECIIWIDGIPHAQVCTM